MDTDIAESLFEPVLLNGRFYLEKKFDSGGMSSIYLAKDILLGEKVVVKLCTRKDKQKEFRREIRLLRSCNHPAIQKVLSEGQYYDYPFYVMPFYESINLREYLDSIYRIPEKDLLEIFMQITDATAYLHKRDIIHNDLKPQNILMEAGDKLVLSDFGLSTRFSRSRRRRPASETIWGSPVYLAPELAEGKFPSFPSDVYSLGVILFLLYTGFPPFFHNDLDILIKMHQTLLPPTPRLIVPNLSSTMNAIILRCLSKQPRDRFKNASELHHEVQTFFTNHPMQVENTIIQRHPDMTSIDQKTRKINNDLLK
ncbi:MAG TPA: hypothetical protein DCK95_03245 [Anaerolineaceae bacterium]|uniref:non-specific serine/threonine protein kinase n=1 Tax=Anaerolinea thermophila TaxID=167964 RepID=A0A101FYG5_9CHLR|nr:MAG: putative non-specific serine/threonine protein kinase [Anaerolinea thermophila]HAF61324.1 hypothetical protein [Anaerolineaceae bacterium]